MGTGVGFQGRFREGRHGPSIPYIFTVLRGNFSFFPCIPSLIMLMSTAMRPTQQPAKPMPFPESLQKL